MTEQDQIYDEEGPLQARLFGDGDSSESEVASREEQEEQPLTAVDMRNASYFVLTIAAIFVINAMETGSYRTPWSVAIVVSLAGFGLLAYSLVKANREKL